MRNLSESHGGFWGTVARKAKAILEDDVPSPDHITPSSADQQQDDNVAARGKYDGQHQASESQRKPDKAGLRKGFGAIASKLNYIGNALEEGLNIVENRTADIIQETRTRRSHIRRKAAPDLNKQSINARNTRDSAVKSPTKPVAPSDLDIQLQASRDVANAMAAKTKLLLRELKTVKADLAFGKEHCAQLEEENRILRISLEKGDNPEDDDLIRLQLESLLGEKARLAQENAFYARENQFLCEVVEYHQLTMQDVVYVNERSEEITEVYPAKVPSMTYMSTVTTVPSLPSSVHAPPELVKKI